MGYVSLKAIKLSGEEYLPGDTIEAQHILPKRKRTLISEGCIAEVADTAEMHAVESRGAQTGDEVKFFIPIACADDGNVDQTMSVPLTENELQHIFAIMQSNTKKATEEIEDVENENVLIVLHAADSRKAVKQAAQNQAGKLMEGAATKAEG